MRRTGILCLAAVLAATISSTAIAQIEFEQIIDADDGLALATFATGTGAPGDDRLFIATRNGRVEVWLGDRLSGTPYLDLSTAVRSGSDAVDMEDEGGLLGISFSPDFANDGYFYVYYTAGDENVSNDLVSRLSRFQAMGDPLTSLVANPQETILAPFPVAQPRSNHNGGTTQVFGDYLYTALGDGGVESTSQDDSTILGKLLRFDLRQDPPTPEVVGKGLRNPYRFSIDSQTGDVYIGDVGTVEGEEISIVASSQISGVAVGAEAPLNFGWPIEEGFFCHGPSAPGDPPCGSPELIPPVYAYDHSGGGIAIVGGIVYRGSIPSLRGQYFFGDWLVFDIFSLRWTEANGLEGDVESVKSEFPPVNQLLAFGTDNDGEMLVVDGNDVIYRLVPEPRAYVLSAAALATTFVIARLRRKRA